MEFTVSEEQAGQRIDKALTELTELTRSALVNLMEQGKVLLNGVPANKKNVLREGDLILIEIPAPREANIVAEDLPLDILYEDEHLLVVNKEKGMVVHPAAGHEDGTLVNALLHHCGDSLSGINGVIRPGIVHRIDKDTSGILIVAKTNEAHLALTEMFKKHDFLRVYNGLVHGRFKDQAGTVNRPIGRDPKDRKKMAVTTVHSREAITHYRVLAEYDKYSLVEFTLETGRTHQIRVHCASLGHAIVGDPLYCPRNLQEYTDQGQFLHAKKIGFRHPISGEYMEFESELPQYFTTFLSKL